MDWNRVFVTVGTTVESEQEARRLADILVDRRLAACVHMGPVNSVYRWQGSVEHAAEWSLVAKTTRARADDLVTVLCAEHAYDVPEILVTPVIGGDERYLSWIESEVS